MLGSLRFESRSQTDNTGPGRGPRTTRFITYAPNFHFSFPSDRRKMTESFYCSICNMKDDPACAIICLKNTADDVCDVMWGIVSDHIVLPINTNVVHAVW